MIVCDSMLGLARKSYEQQYRDSPLCHDNENNARTRFADTCRDGSNEETR